MDLFKIKKPRIEKIHILSFLFVISVVFADILGNGNLNLLYFFGAFLFIKNFKTRKTYIKDVLCLYIPLVVIVIFEVLFGYATLSYIKVIVYMLKILACISLTAYVKSIFWKINIKKIIESISAIFAILLVVAIFTIKYDILWRLNDDINQISKTRLQFFYSEPSVLGIVCGLLIIVISYFVLIEDVNHKILQEFT